MAQEREAWVDNDEMNNNYFGNLSEIYADTNELVLSHENEIRGFRFWQKHNRLAPALLV